MWFDIITRQNYFAHKKQIVVQHDGLAMGVPSSGLIAEIFLQHIEHSYIIHSTQKHKIINYCRYVDDILIIFDPNHSNIQEITNDFNSLHPKLQFMAETEDNYTLNYLDLSIRRTPTSLRTAIFRKPTFTDTIIPFTSNHPTQHKYATVRYLYNRLDSYNLKQKEYQQELNIIHNILHNNSFPIKPYKPPNPNPDKQITTHT
jgi:glycerol-3-phosphate cytidylyltransferase-like family protein